MTRTEISIDYYFSEFLEILLTMSAAMLKRAARKRKDPAK